MHVATIRRLCQHSSEPHAIVPVLVPLTAYKVKIHTPPDGVARVGRLVGADGEVAFVHGLLDVPSEIEHVFDFVLVDLLDDRPHLDARIVGAGIADDFEHRHALGPLQLQLFLNLFVHRRPTMTPKSSPSLAASSTVIRRPAVSFAVWPGSGLPSRPNNTPHTTRALPQRRALVVPYTKLLRCSPKVGASRCPITRAMVSRSSHHET